jgi:hypothetical protein
MRAPRKTPPRTEPPRRPTAIRSAVTSAQIRPTHKFTPNAEKQMTATVGMNPDPPVVHSAAPELNTVVPYSAGSPVSYAPFGYGLDPW